MQAVQEQLVSSFICGATGACCTASNTYQHLYRQIFDLMTSNRIAEAYEVQSKIRRWLLLYKQANSAKHVLNAIGLPINVASRRDGTVTGERLAHARTLAELVKAEI